MLVGASLEAWPSTGPEYMNGRQSSRANDANADTFRNVILSSSLRTVEADPRHSVWGAFRARNRQGAARSYPTRMLRIVSVLWREVSHARTARLWLRLVCHVLTLKARRERKEIGKACGLILPGF